MDAKLTFGDIGLDYAAATNHFAYIGATGSGKTVLIRLLMQSVLKIATKRKVSTRLLVYDSKREMLPVLHGIFEHLERTDAEQRIKLINPFDSRSAAWDLAADIKSPAHAQELAAMIIPENENAKEPFFPNAARLIVENVMLSFIEAFHRKDTIEEGGKRPWTLRDVCNAVETKEKIELVLGRSTRTDWIPKALFDDKRTAGNILATIAAAMRPYRIIAALWDKASKERDSISLHKWLKGEEKENVEVLILGNSPTSRTTIDAINQVLFKRLSQIILEERQDLDLEKDPSRIWVVMDEFVRAGKLRGATELATEGRSKGVAFVVGFQDVNGLYSVYGRDVGEEIVGQCSSVALLRAQSPDTAEWESRFIGDYRLAETKINYTTSAASDTDASDGNVQTSVHKENRRDTLPSYFRDMQPVSKQRKRGISGVFCSPYFPKEIEEDEEKEVRFLPRQIDYIWLFGQKKSEGEEEIKPMLWRKNESQKGFESREVAHQYLDAWRPEDKAELKLDKPVKPKEDADPLANTGKPASSGKNESEAKMTAALKRRGLLKIPQSGE